MGRISDCRVATGAAGPELAPAADDSALADWGFEALQVLMDAASADAALLIGCDGSVIASAGLTETEARFLVTGCSAGVAPAGELAELAMRNRMLTWYHLPVPAGEPRMARVVLATDGMASRRPELAPVLPLLEAIGRGLSVRTSSYSEAV